MARLFYLVIAINIILAQALRAEYKPYKDEQIGEYYEYDLEGTPKERDRRKARYHARKTIKAPFKASRALFHVSKKTLKKTSRLIKNYLSGKKGTYKGSGDLNKALTTWEGALGFDPRGSSAERSRHEGMFFIPHELWRLLKYSLYVAGFRLPRAIKKELIKMVYGTFGYAHKSNIEARS